MSDFKKILSKSRLYFTGFWPSLLFQCPVIGFSKKKKEKKEKKKKKDVQ
jgi:hypothetical protein